MTPEIALSIVATIVSLAAFAVSYREASLNCPRLRLRGGWAFLNAEQPGIAYLTRREPPDSVGISYDRIFVMLRVTNFGRQPTTIESIAFPLFDKKTMVPVPVSPGDAGSTLPILIGPGETKKFFYDAQKAVPAIPGFCAESSLGNVCLEKRLEFKLDHSWSSRSMKTRNWKA